MTARHDAGSRSLGAITSLAFLLVLVVLPGADADAPATVEQVTLERSIALDPQNGDYEPGCNGGHFDINQTSRSFTFGEGDGNSVYPPTREPGYYESACGDARFTVQVPPGATRVTLRFDFDRQIGHTLQGAPDAFEQTVSIEGADGRALFPTRLAESSDPPHALQAFESVPVALAADAGSIVVHWRFADTGVASLGGLTQVAISDADVASTIGKATVTFGGIALRPDQVEVDRQVQRSGRLFVERNALGLDLSDADLAGGDVAVRVSVHADWSLDSVRLPDGTVVRSSSTRFAPGPNGFDRSLPLVEESGGLRAVTLSGAITSLQGPGRYVLTFQSVTDTTISTWLIPVALVLLAAPLPFAALAFTQVARFEREAFGGFSRSARRLRWAVLLVAVYYLVVVGSAFLGDRLDLMAALPISGEALLLYVQVIIAIIAFAVLQRVARELQAITRPPAQLPEPQEVHDG